MPSNSLSGLRNFNKQLERKRVSFACPRCNTLLLSKHFQKHCAKTHDLNPLLCCVWCWGETTWNAGKKCKNVDHMIRCWQDFLARYASPTVQTDDVPQPPIADNLIVYFDTTPMCPKQNLFSRPRILEYADRFYDPIWLLPLCPDSNTLTFSGCDGGIDLAASCLRLYIQLRKTMDFIHVMVRAVAFPSFARAMDNDGGVSRTLPFWTLCDGGVWPQARHRQHRHMIVVSPKGYFYHHVWNKVCPDDRPSSDYKCKIFKPIQSTKHFIYTLGYLSKRESSCNFTIQDPTTDDTTTTTTKLNHFYIYTPLPKDYKLILATQYEDGILELLRWKYPDFAIDQLLRSPVEFVDQKWKLKIKHLPGIPLGIQLPISEDLAPCSHQTTAFIHLTGDKRIYFERDSLSQDQPTFYHIVGEEYFTFQKRHQRDLNLTKPMAAEIARLKQQVDDLTDENIRCKRKFDDLTAENIQCKRKFDDLTAENTRQVDNLTAEITRLNQKLSQQNTRMQRLLQNETMKLQLWKRKAQKWQRKHYALNLKMLEAEIVRCREEIVKCREEIVRYKEENDTLKKKLKSN